MGKLDEELRDVGRELRTEFGQSVRLYLLDWPLSLMVLATVAYRAYGARRQRHVVHPRGRRGARHRLLRFGGIRMVARHDDHAAVGALVAQASAAGSNSVAVGAGMTLSGC